MSDITNSSADPWGLPEDDTFPAPVEPVAEPEPPEDVDTPDVEPVETFQPLPQEPEIETEEVDSSGEQDHDEPPEPPPAEPTSRGPLSQVLAASGFFGGSPPPPATDQETVEVTEERADADEPHEAADLEVADEPAESAAAGIDVGALEDAEQDPVAEPPDLAAPTAGAVLGMGGTDDDLPSEPPPWMVTEPGEPEPVDDDLDDVFEEIAPATEETIDEAAAAFADVSFVDEVEEAKTTDDLPAAADDATILESDSEFESLVAEIADTALEIEEDAESVEVDSEITIDPDDTPSVFRELEDLPEDDRYLVDEASVSIEEAVGESDEITEAEDVVDDAARSSAEWGVFEYTEEPSEPDAPVFGVTFGTDDEEAVSGDDEAAEKQDEEMRELPDFAAILPDTTDIDEDTEPTITDETDGIADFAAILPDTTDIDEVIESVVADEIDEFSSEESELPAGGDEPDPGYHGIESSGLATDVPQIVEPETLVPVESDDEAVDETPEAEPEAVPIEWGSRWQESAQGWVEDDQGRSTWRPIVTTSPLLSEWQIDTYLGVVSADVVLGSGSIEVEMAAGRTSAMRNLVDEAMARGAHAIVGVSSTLAPVGTATVLTATGTAVTLKAQE